MSSAPEPTPLERKYLAEIFNRKSGKMLPYDRRRLWSREDREYRGWDGLSGGEQKARNAFARMIADRTPKVDAVKRALGIDKGYLKAFETKAEFEDFWSTDLLETIADRWIASPYFRSFARTAIKGAQNKAAAHADLAVQTLVDTCGNAKTSSAARAKAAQVLLGIAGLTVGSQLDQEIGGEKNQLRKKARLTLLKPSRPEPEPSGDDESEGAEPAAVAS